MELIVNDVQLPEKIVFNYDELKAELTEKVHVYEAMVYGENEIKEAKADRASLNKLKKALNDERIRREKEYMMPFNEFKTKINEIISIIDKPVAIIDAQVKEYENKKRNEKADAISALWDGKEKPDWLALDSIHDESWLNASTSLKSIGEAMDAKLAQIKADLGTLAKLSTFCFEATEEYKRTLDLNKAIAEGQRLADMQRRKLEAQDKARELAEKIAAEQSSMKAQTQAETEADTPRTWVAFKALLNVAQAKELKAFFDARGIRYESIAQEAGNGNM